VLNLNNTIVGSHLELIRRICEPESTTHPHITIRFFDKLYISEDYRMAKFNHIDIIEPGRFPAKKGWPRRAVYLRCELDDASLLLLEHKPHHPSGDFHITLYDGDSEAFGSELLVILKQYQWGFRVDLSEAYLSEIIIGKAKRTKKEGNNEYSSDVRRLFNEITSHKLTYEYLINLRFEDRLMLVQRLCKNLMNLKIIAELEASQRHIGIDSYTNKHYKSKYNNGEDFEYVVHPTPPELAYEIATIAIGFLKERSLDIHFGDPAVGNGVFFGALLKALNQNSINSACGIDINPDQVLAAKRRWQQFGLDVMVGDFLHLDKMEKRTLILANPPYLRYQKIKPNYKKSLRERAFLATGIDISGSAGLYVYFLILSHKWMQPNAIAAWLIPSNFMVTNYGMAIREYLTTKVQLLRIHNYDATVPQFESVKIIPSVVVFRNKKPDSKTIATLSFGKSLLKPYFSEDVKVSDLSSQNIWNIPINKSVDKINSCLISDLFEVRRGIATGANNFFILERKEAKILGIPENALRPILPKSRVLQSNIIESDEDGYPNVKPQLVLIDCNLSENDISILYPEFYKYLLKGKNEGIVNRALVKNRHPWYKQENRKPAPYLCTYMGRGKDNKPPVHFIWNKSKAIATNTYLMLFPKRSLEQVLSTQPEYEQELFKVLQNTAEKFLDWPLREYADGLKKIEPKGLQNVQIEGCPTWLKLVKAFR